MSKDIYVFFELLKAGLWRDQRPVSCLKFQVPSDIDWEREYQIAEEQAVVGIVAAGLEVVQNVQEFKEFKISQKAKYQFIGQTMLIEKRNKEMNAFVADLIEKLRNKNIYALLVKGQGIAQCYEKPLWRTCGDVDLLMSEDNYRKACEYLGKIADSTERETKKNKERKHQDYQISGWAVELHGTLHSHLSGRVDREIDKVQGKCFYGGSVRSGEFKSSKGSSVQVFLPGANEDVFFVFTHILQHLFLEGIGLRQICDWCRLLYIYRDSLNHKLLEQRLRKAGLMSEWKVFASFAVNWLGMPMEAMPLYYENDNENEKLKRKAERICRFVMEVGNFGHNREVKWNDSFNRRAMLIWHRITDTVKLLRVFPIDAPKFLLNYAWGGVRNLICG